MITDARLTYFYLTKYILKHEEPSRQFHELIKSVLKNDRLTRHQKAAKLIFKIMGGRDMSVQEVAFLIHLNELYDTDLYFESKNISDSIAIQFNSKETIKRTAW